MVVSNLRENSPRVRGSNQVRITAGAGVRASASASPGSVNEQRRSQPGPGIRASAQESARSVPDMCGKASCQCLSMRNLCLPILVLHLLLWALRPDVLFSVHSGTHAKVPDAPLDVPTLQPTGVHVTAMPRVSRASTYCRIISFKGIIETCCQLHLHTLYRLSREAHWR